VKIDAFLLNVLIISGLIKKSLNVNPAIKHA